MISPERERDLRAFARRAGHKIIGVFKETASGAKNDRPERKKVLALAQAREIDAILVTELSRWGRSTQDLVQTLDDLHSWKISVLAQNGLSFDLSTASGTVRPGSRQGARRRPWPAGQPAPLRQEGQEGARHGLGRSRAYKSK